MFERRAVGNGLIIKSEERFCGLECVGFHSFFVVKYS